CTMNCTVATEAVARLCGFSSRDGDALLAGTVPGADGLLMLPFLNGERTPDLPHGRGNLFGMTATNLTPANLYRSAMEGALYSLMNGYDGLVDAGLRFEAIRLTGGGSQSAVWRQMVADMFGLPVDVPEQSEGAAFGAALQALWAVRRAEGGSDNELSALAASHVRLDPRLAAQPHAGATAAYAAQYRHFLSHLDAIRPLYADCPPDSHHVTHGYTHEQGIHRREGILPRHRHDLLRRSGFGQPARVQGLRRGEEDRRQDHARAPALRGLLLAHLLQRRRRSIRPGHPPLPLGEGRCDGHGRGQGRCRVRVLHQDRRAVLVLPRCGHGAGRRRHRHLREEPQAPGRPGQGAPAGHRHEAAVGHGQPVLAPALHERCLDQPRLQRGRPRGGAG